MAPFKAVIVGGGLAGSCLANGLLNKAKDPIDVIVFERDKQGSNREGYQIRLGASALVGFRACLTADQYQGLLRCFGRSGGVVSSAPAIFNKEMKLLLDLGQIPAYDKSAPIGRGRLRDFLHS
ncbi:NADP-binding Rossmann-like domain-containing protein, partial [Fusarium mundagurra]